MTRSLLPCLIATLVCAAGCTSINRLSTEETFDPDKESVVVLGLRPENHRIQLFPGSVENERWSENIFGLAAFYGAAQDGYVLSKVPSDKPLAITMINVVADEKKILGTSYRPCGDSQTLVVQVPKGKVVYLTDLTYREAGNRLGLEYADDFESASRHVDAKFPSLQRRLERGTFSLMPTGYSCGPQTIYIPVFIPKT